MKLLCLLGTILLAHAVYAGQPDTLRSYRPGSSIYYRDPDILVQAARFDLPRPARILGISVLLAGNNREGTARLRLFGGEAGASAPLLEADLVSPIFLHKSRAGEERIWIPFASPVRIEDDQFFVAIDQLSSGTKLISDRRRRKPVCVDSNGSYYHQLLKKTDGRWEWGKYGFAIDVVLEYDDTRPSHPLFSDITIDARIPDSTLANGAMSWGDINSDGWLDFLGGGRLYRSAADGTFLDATTDAGFTGIPTTQLLIDHDNDGDLDILSFASDSASNASLHVNDGYGHFTVRRLVIPGVVRPGCFALSDVDGDSYPDLFIGQGASSDPALPAGALYRNNGADGFVLDSSIRIPSGTNGGVVAAQWVDADGDGAAELFAALGDGRTMLFRPTRDRDNPGTGSGEITITNDARGTRGCDWADYDNDGDPDLLLPARFEARNGQDYIRGANRQVMTDRGDIYAVEHDRLPDGIAPAFERSGGSWGDCDNDGQLDFIIASSCACTSVELYRGNDGHCFERATYRVGLRRVSGGPDAVWVDYNNDGRLDLALIREGRLHLFRNNGTQGNSIELDLHDPAGAKSGLGADVTVYAGGQTYTRQVSSGRGLAVQDPLRVHVGIGTATAVDSVVVRWPGSAGRTTHTGLAVNRLHRINSGRTGGGQAAVSLEAYPNPFTDRLVFRYTLTQQTAVRLEIYTADGRMIDAIEEGSRMPGEYTVLWQPARERMAGLPAGTYLYRLRTSAGDVSGKATRKE